LADLFEGFQVDLAHKEFFAVMSAFRKDASKGIAEE